MHHARWGATTEHEGRRGHDRRPLGDDPARAPRRGRAGDGGCRRAGRAGRGRAPHGADLHDHRPRQAGLGGGRRAGHRGGARSRPDGRGSATARLLAAATLDDLVAEARRTAADGQLDVRAILAIQRTAGAIAARADRRLVLFLGRYEIMRRLAWERCVARDARRAARAPTRSSGIARLRHALERADLARGDRRLPRRRARHRRPRRRGSRGALQELLGVVRGRRGVTAARLRRVAIAPRPEPGRAAIGWWRSRRARRPTRRRSGRASTTTTSSCSRAHRAPARVDRARRRGGRRRHPAAGRVPAPRADRRPRDVHDWAGLSRIPTALDSVFGGLAATTSTARRARPRPRRRAAVAGVGRRRIAGDRRRRRRWPPRYADIVDATRTAQRLGLRGWIADPERLAVERLLLADRDLADAAVRRELGPLLADERMGDVLDRDAAGVLRCRREHARDGAPPAPRDANGRLPAREDRGPARRAVDATTRRRLSVALMVMRLRDATG